MLALLGLLVGSLVFFQIRVLLGMNRRSDGQTEAQALSSPKSINGKEKRNKNLEKERNVSAAGLRGSEKNDAMKQI